MNEDKGRLIDSWYVVFLPSLFMVLLFTLQYLFNKFTDLLIVLFN
ncbi:hypothetical protein HMPREF1014_05537 [Bacillus sp. 7_6_55CFAA_CT2]|nr:hypothetical protein HMPREF1014_05537 [Bacillus sp. 7_6_55CFAA_CT2]